MSKVLGFMKQVARGLQVEGNFGTAHVYRSSLNAIIAYRGKDDLIELFMMGGYTIYFCHVVK